MRKTLIYLTTIILILGCKSNQPLTERQIAKKNYQEVIGESKGDYLVPDKYAMYPNGRRGIDDHNSKNTKFTLGARLAGMERIVIAGFVVEKNGEIKEIEIIQSVHP